MRFRKGFSGSGFRDCIGFELKNSGYGVPKQKEDSKTD